MDDTEMTETAVPSPEFEFHESENAVAATADSAISEEEDVINFEYEMDVVGPDDADADADAADGGAEDDEEEEEEEEGEESGMHDPNRAQHTAELVGDDVLEETVERVKRPSSSWMIYMNQNRQRLKEEQPTLSIGEVAKTLSVEYRGLSQELLDVYLDLARKDKERYAEAMAKLRSTGQVERGAGLNFAPLKAGETILPLARVKKTMKCDPAVKNVQKEALSVIAKATELFIEYVARKSGVIAAKRGVKTVKGADFVRAIHDDDVLEFLCEDFPLSSVVKTTKSNKRILPEGGDAHGNHADDKAKSRKKGQSENVASGKSSLLNYFGEK